MAMLGGSHSTIGAGKSGAQSRRRFGPDSLLVVATMWVALFLLSPVAGATMAVVALASQVRRVRASRLVGFACAATALGLIVARFDVSVMLSWHGEGMLAWWARLHLLDPFVAVWNVAGEVFGFDSISAPSQVAEVVPGLLRMLPLGVPLGAWLGAAYAGWMTARRAALVGFEGKDFDWSRPVGFLDRRRQARSAAALETGEAVATSEGSIGVGVGAYGALVSMPVDSLLRPMLVFGGPRQGKTRLTISLLFQAAVMPWHPAPCSRSGVLVVDFKGDAEVPALWAEFAATHGRRFLHFQPRDKDGAAYRAPFPGVPNTPAHYDPLRSGNANSKTEMLLDSVGREGDAAAYLRQAKDVVQIAYQVASITGYDRDKGGFEVLNDLLDLKKLQRVADMVDPATGQAYLKDHQDVARRVQELSAGLTGSQTLRGGITDSQTTLSGYVTGEAAGPWLRPGPDAESTIDLVRAVLDGDIVVFSLSVQDYSDVARNIGTMVLLDLQNAIASLRTLLGQHRRSVGNPNAPTPWAPFYVEIEEFGSAAAQAVLGVLNKAGDVQVRPTLSTQSWHDIVAVDEKGVFAHQVLEMAGNVMTLSINDGDAATVLSDMTPEVGKLYPRERKEYSGGLLGAGLKAANTGQMEVTRDVTRQVPPSAFQTLDRFHVIWYTKPGQVTHTFPARANAWWEDVLCVPVPASIHAEPDWRPEDRGVAGLVQTGDDPLDDGDVLDDVNPWGDGSPAPSAAPAAVAPVAPGWDDDWDDGEEASWENTPTEESPWQETPTPTSPPPARPAPVPSSPPWEPAEASAPPSEARALSPERSAPGFPGGGPAVPPTPAAPVAPLTPSPVGRSPITFTWQKPAPAAVPVVEAEPPQEPTVESSWPDTPVPDVEEAEPTVDPAPEAAQKPPVELDTEPAAAPTLTVAPAPTPQPEPATPTVPGNDPGVTPATSNVDSDSGPDFGGITW